MKTEMSSLSYGYFIEFGTGTYYEGDKAYWKDMDVPERPGYGYTWSPNPDRPTYSDWLFDGHDADGGYWE